MYVRSEWNCLEEMEEEVREKRLATCSVPGTGRHRREDKLSGTPQAWLYIGLRCREPQTLGQFRNEKMVSLETGIQRGEH